MNYIYKKNKDKSDVAYLNIFSNKQNISSAASSIKYK